MKKILLFLLSLVLFSGCYTTFYPPANMDMSAADNIPDSTRQVIVNNYYETTEYYQVPYYHRYSLLWDGYYWDPFYYDYGYYHWRPYYWYGHYYYYNPHNHYWYYYDHYYPWHSGDWSGSNGNNGNKQRIHKPGYNVLTTTGSGSSLPFVSGNSNDNNRITKPVKKVGIDLNTDVRDNDGYYTTSKPRIESVGKTTTTNGNKKTPVYGKSNDNTNKKPSSTSYQTKKQSSSSQSSTRSSSSNTKISKPSNTSSSSSKNSNNESSSSSSKKSK